MLKNKKILSIVLTILLPFIFSACSTENKASDKTAEMTAIEDSLNLVNMNAKWTYNDSADAWTLSVVTSVKNPEIEDKQGVSVCVPGAYVKGVDKDSDGKVDATSGTVTGRLVIDYDTSVTSTNGQVYTAKTAPVIINTGAAGYSEQSNQTASSSYAKEGYINVACGNRGKQSQLSDGTYTGDAPLCLVDQKNSVRFVKYNILLGNLPGSVDYFVSTGGSGGGAHATMLAATSDNADFYDYEIEVGAVWTRIMDDYGHVDDDTPSFAISLYKEYRSQGIGSQLMVKMLELLKWQGYERASLAVQKANYAVKMYENVGFKIVDENAEEYIMVCEL